MTQDVLIIRNIIKIRKKKKEKKYNNNFKNTVLHELK
jgi:uncharacterized protein (UPF0335 family)